ncbi:MAG: DUF2283 domain-containing protein [Candidatus Korarchaeota archaeon]|nr:DUF2283 domain-containing protein [Candidatus Korarchaeota archaeon]
MPNFVYDHTADALYIRFSDKRVSKSTEITEGIIVDYSKDGSIVGIEIPNYSKRNLNLNKLISLSDQLSK